MCRRCALQHEAGDLLIVRNCMAVLQGDSAAQ
jgi:hypothetical protein